MMTCVLLLPPPPPPQKKCEGELHELKCHSKSLLHTCVEVSLL